MMVAANAHTFSRAAAVGLLALAQLLGQSGDLARGKALFQSGGCVNCHRIGDAGSRVGPNLSDIGDRREAERLQQSILAPDDEVIPENRYVNVTMKDGTVHRGEYPYTPRLEWTYDQLAKRLEDCLPGFALGAAGLQKIIATCSALDQHANVQPLIDAVKKP